MLISGIVDHELDGKESNMREEAVRQLKAALGKHFRKARIDMSIHYTMTGPSATRQTATAPCTSPRTIQGICENCGDADLDDDSKWFSMEELALLCVH